MKHIFDVEIAAKYGVCAAILLENIAYWTVCNEANGVHFHDGYYWTYNSRKAYHEIFPYFGEKQIYNTLKSLVDDGILMTGNYNKHAFDRTAWYALTQKGKCIVHLGQCTVQKGQTIPLINSILENDNINITNSNSICTKRENKNIYCASEKNDEQISVFEEAWKLYPEKKGKNAVSKKAKQEIEKAGIDVIRKAITGYLADVERKRSTGFDLRYMYGSTFFNGRWQDYLQEDQQTAQLLTKKGEPYEILAEEGYYKILHKDGSYTLINMRSKQATLFAPSGAILDDWKCTEDELPV